MPRMKDDEIRFRAALIDAQKSGSSIDLAAVAAKADVTPSRAAALYRKTQPQKPSRKWVAGTKKGTFLSRRDMAARAAAKVEASSASPAVAQDVSPDSASTGQATAAQPAAAAATAAATQPAKAAAVAAADAAPNAAPVAAK